MNRATDTIPSLRCSNGIAAGISLKKAWHSWRNFACSILGKEKVDKISYRNAFQTLAKVDPLAAPIEELNATIQQHGINVGLAREETNRDAFLNIILSELVEPKLGIRNPTIVYDWPVTQSALAIVRREDEFELAERFELYVDGVELANGYHELLDPEELSRRNSMNNQLRLRDGHALLPEHSRLLEAMKSGLENFSGVALGLDRLVMLLTGARSIREVMAFPLDRA